MEKNLSLSEEELKILLKKLGFVTKKDLQSIVIKQVVKLTKKHYLQVAHQLERLNNLLTRKLLGKSKYVVSADLYPLDRELN